MEDSSVVASIGLQESGDAFIIAMTVAIGNHLSPQ